MKAPALGVKRTVPAFRSGEPIERNEPENEFIRNGTDPALFSRAE